MEQEHPRGDEGCFGYNHSPHRTLEWKLLPNVSGNEKVDQLPIIVSGEGTMKPLSVPKNQFWDRQSNGKGSVGLFVFGRMGIKDRVQEMSFDAAASNTGLLLGACTLQQQDFRLPPSCPRECMSQTRFSLPVGGQSVIMFVSKIIIPIHE